MPGENIVSVEPLFSEKIGARIMAVAVIKLPTKYLTKGSVLSETQLKECGLTNGLVDVAWPVYSAYEEFAVEQPIVQISVINPSATPYPKAEAQVVKVQQYESVTTAKNKEVASEGELNKKALVTIVLIGR